MKISQISSRITRFFKSKSNLILLSVILVLSVALAFSVSVNVRKAHAVKAANASISADEEKLMAAEKEISDIKAQLDKQQQSNTDLQSQLEAKQNEKSQLEAEIGNLKKQIETLSAQKAAEKEQAQPVPAPVPIQRPPGSGICYLTFDDGPSQNTPIILDILNSYGVKATFFVKGSEYISYVKNIFDAGNSVGLHTFCHDYNTIYSSVDAYFADLQHISDTVEQITGTKSTIMRFPGGSSNTVSKKYCKGIMSQLATLVGERGYSYFDWNVSSGDAERETPQADFILNNVIGGAQNKNSICVLMHDSSSKTTTVDALPSIIEGLTTMGFTFDTIKPDTYGYHHPVFN